MNIRKKPEMAINVISQIRQLTQDYLKNELECAGLTGLVSSHGHILGCLYARDHLPMRSIADMIGRRKSTLTVLADKLEQEGYIQREVSPDDNRVRQISLTPKGHGTRSIFLEINDRLQRQIWQGFSPDEKLQAMNFLLRMEANVESLHECHAEVESADSDNKVRQQPGGRFGFTDSTDSANAPPSGR